MKKLLFVLALGTFAACGSSETEVSTTDSLNADSATIAPAPSMDTTMMDTTSGAAMMDTTHTDSTKH